MMPLDCFLFTIDGKRVWRIGIAAQSGLEALCHNLDPRLEQVSWRA